MGDGWELTPERVAMYEQRLRDVKARAASGARRITVLEWMAEDVAEDVRRRTTRASGTAVEDDCG